MIMNKNKFAILLILLLTGFISVKAQNKVISFEDLAPSNLKVLSKNEITNHNLRHFIDSLITLSWQNWKSGFENRKSPESRSEHYKILKQKFIEAIGGLPKRTPMYAEVTGTINKGDYKVEKIIFQSLPDFYLTGDLYLPSNEKYNTPFPGVIIPCGHYEDSKAHDEYQSMGALCALNGMAALVYDPIGQGERLQFRSDKENRITWGTSSHNLDGLREILLGGNVARYEIWDGMRAIDYLQTRSDIDSNAIGITGNSGGGTQTSYIMALDKRVKVAAPSCYLHNLNSQSKNSRGDAEQLIFGQLSFGMDHPDYVLMNAPRPVKLLAATHDFFKINAVWETFRYLKRYYTEIGYSENVDILENDAGHNYNKTQREAAARWLTRYLLGKEKVIFEPHIDLISESELNVTPKGQVLKITNAKSIFDLQNEKLKEEDKHRLQFLESTSPDKIRKQVKNLIQCKDYAEIESPKVILKKKIETNECQIQKLILATENNVFLPALLFIPKQEANNGKVLFLSEEGKAFNLNKIKKLIRKGNTVLSVDLSGIGETKPEIGEKMNLSDNLSSAECFNSYLLGKSVVGLRVNEIFTCVKFLINKSSSKSNVYLIADGEVGVPALHAAFLDPALFTNVRITNSLYSWRDVIHSERSFDQLVNVVNGALNYYDIPNLVNLLEDKIKYSSSTNALGFEINKSGYEIRYSDEPKYHGLAGIWYGQMNLKNPEGPDLVDSLNLSWSNQIDRRGRDWSAEWFGFIKSPYTGRVTFIAETNQNIEIDINEKQIIDINTNQLKADGTINLEKNNIYLVRIVFGQNGVDSSYIKINWKWKGHAESGIKENHLLYSQKQKHKMDTAWR